jgi:uncharacterized protein (DUF2237 family)
VIQRVLISKFKLLQILRVLPLFPGFFYLLDRFTFSTQDFIQMTETMNILGTPLQLCCKSPLTGFFRDGYCKTGSDDLGRHVVCARMTAEFLEFTRSKGNDLSTPLPAYNFPGLKPGDKWCLCALRWKEAYHAGVAPPVIPEATHVRALDYIPLEILQAFALDRQN